MFVLFMIWGIVGAKDKLDIIHTINFILKVNKNILSGHFTSDR